MVAEETRSQAQRPDCQESHADRQDLGSEVGLVTGLEVDLDSRTEDVVEGRVVGHHGIDSDMVAAVVLVVDWVVAEVERTVNLISRRFRKLCLARVVIVRVFDQKEGNMEDYPHGFALLEKYDFISKVFHHVNTVFRHSLQQERDLLQE